MDDTMDSALAGLGMASAGGEAISRENFDDIVRGHQRRIYRVLLSLLRDPDAADTLTQECFLRAFKNREGFRGESSVGTWLVRIAVNLARDHVRSRRQSFWRKLLGGPSEDVAGVAEVVPDRRATPEQLVLAREQVGAVWHAVEHLSPQQRTIFVLRFVEEMSLEEIAAAMSLETGTVKSHLWRALAAVRKRVKDQAR